MIQSKNKGKNSEINTNVRQEKKYAKTLPIQSFQTLKNRGNGVLIEKGN